MKLVLDGVCASNNMGEFNTVIQSAKETMEEDLNVESKLYSETIESISISS